MKNTKVKEREILIKGSRVNDRGIQVEIVQSHNSINKQLCEVVQGALDAKASYFGVATRGKTSDFDICFVDNGSGMTLNELQNFMDFGFSNKDASTQIGHKGLGTSTLYNCKKTLVYTKSKNDKYYLLTMYKMNNVNYEEPTIEVLADDETSSGNLLQIAGVQNLFSDLEELKIGTVIITIGNPCFSKNKITTFSTKDLKTILLKDTHLGSHEFFKYFGEGNSKLEHITFPKIELNIFDDRKIFYGYRRLLDEDILKARGFNDIDFDSISNSYKLLLKLNEIKKHINLSIIYKKSFPLGILGPVEVCAIFSDTLIKQNNKSIGESTKRDYRGCKIGKDYLPVQTLLANENGLGIDHNVFENYCYIYVNCQGVKLNLDRREIIVDEIMESNMEIIKSYVKSVINENIKEIKKIHANDFSVVNNIIETIDNLVKEEKTISINRSAISHLKKKKISPKVLYTRTEEEYVKNLLLDLNEYDVDGIDFTVVAVQPRSRKGCYNVLTIDSDLYPKYVKDLKKGIVHPNVKPAEIELSLRNFFEHGHDVEKVGAIICANIKGFKADGTPHRKYEFALIKEEGKYFLTKGDRQIPVYVLDEIVANNLK